MPRNIFPKEDKAKAASESRFTSSLCASALQRFITLFKKLFKTSASLHPWRMSDVSGEAQGAEEALMRAVCLSKASSEVGKQNYCKCQIKASHFHKHCTPTVLSWHRGKACVAWLWISS